MPASLQLALDWGREMQIPERRGVPVGSPDLDAERQTLLRVREDIDERPGAMVVGVVPQHVRSIASCQSLAPVRVVEDLVELTPEGSRGVPDRELLVKQLSRTGLAVGDHRGTGRERIEDTGVERTVGQGRARRVVHHNLRGRINRGQFVVGDRAAGIVSQRRYLIPSSAVYRHAPRPP